MQKYAKISRAAYAFEKVQSFIDLYKKRLYAESFYGAAGWYRNEENTCRNGTKENNGKAETVTGLRQWKTNLLFKLYVKYNYERNRMFPGSRLRKKRNRKQADIQNRTRIIKETEDNEKCRKKAD